jgi:uncharacterized protein
VKIPDVNVLLYAYDDQSAHHDTARIWLEEALSNSERTGLPWPVLVGFVRLSTHPVVYPRPLSAGEALDIVDRWLEHPYGGVVEPGDTHGSLLRELLDAAGVAADLTTDAHLAAIAIEHGATLASFDGDFHRFTGLKFEHLR